MSKDDPSDLLTSLRLMTCQYLAEKICHEEFPEMQGAKSQVTLTRDELARFLACAINVGWIYRNNEEGAAQFDVIELAKKAFKDFESDKEH